MRGFSIFLIKSALFLPGLIVALFTIFVDISMFVESQLSILIALFSLVPLWIGGALMSFAFTERVDDFVDWLGEGISSFFYWVEDVPFWIGEFISSCFSLLWKLVSGTVAFLSVFIGAVVFFFLFFSQVEDGRLHSPSSFNEAVSFILLALLLYGGVLLIRYLVYLISLVFAPNKKVIKQPDFPSQPELGDRNAKRGSEIGGGIAKLARGAISGISTISILWGAPVAPVINPTLMESATGFTSGILVEAGGSSIGKWLGSLQDKEEYERAVAQYQSQVYSMQKEYEDAVRQNDIAYYRNIILPRVNRLCMDALITFLFACFLSFGYWS